MSATPIRPKTLAMAALVAALIFGQACSQSSSKKPEGKKEPAAQCRSYERYTGGRCVDDSSEQRNRDAEADRRRVERERADLAATCTGTTPRRSNRAGGGCVTWRVYCEELGRSYVDGQLDCSQTTSSSLAFTACPGRPDLVLRGTTTTTYTVASATDCVTPDEWCRLKGLILTRSRTGCSRDGLDTVGVGGIPWGFNPAQPIAAAPVTPGGGTKKSPYAEPMTPPGKSTPDEKTRKPGTGGGGNGGSGDGGSSGIPDGSNNLVEVDETTLEAGVGFSGLKVASGGGELKLKAFRVGTQPKIDAGADKNAPPSTSSDATTSALITIPGNAKAIATKVGQFGFKTLTVEARDEAVFTVKYLAKCETGSWQMEFDGGKKRGIEIQTAAYEGAVAPTICDEQTTLLVAGFENLLKIPTKQKIADKDTEISEACVFAGALLTYWDRGDKGLCTPAPKAP